MMYPFLTLDDGTEIVHSQMLEQGKVKVYIEKADAKDGFHHATCILPEYRWEDIFGFTQEDIAGYQKIIENSADLIIEFAKDGGFQNASGFKIGSYWVYFWTNENDPLEPVHVHVAEGSPQPNATKIWIEIVTECQKYLDDYSNGHRLPFSTDIDLLLSILDSLS